LVGIHRGGDNRNVAELRVLVGVTANELVDYMIKHRMELYQSPDMPVLAPTLQN
ncbi:hypothetical protein TSMEX_005342, partial [Taenia solium]